MAGRTYKIGEVGKMLNLKSHVLRFWEGEFPTLAPARAAGGARLYTEEDIGQLRKIRSLVHEQGLSLEAARRVLAGEPGQLEPARLAQETCLLDAVKKELLEVRKILAAPREGE